MAYKQISPQVVAEGGTGVSTLTGVVTGNGTSAVTANAITQYKVLVGGASNAVTEVASVGSSGEILTSNGAGVAPTFQASAGAGGSLVLLSTKTAASVSVLEFTSLISATYTTYLIVSSNITPSSDGGLRMQVSDDNGSTYIATNYQSQIQHNAYDANTFTSATSTTDMFFTGGIEATSSFGSANVHWLYNVGNGQQFMMFGKGLMHAQGTSKINKQWLQARNTSTAVNAFKFYHASAANFSGKFVLYGLIQ